MVMCFFLKSFSFGLSINSVDCFDLWPIFQKKILKFFFMKVGVKEIFVLKFLSYSLTISISGLNSNVKNFSLILLCV